MRVLVLNAGSSSLKGSIVDTVDLAAIAKDEVSLGVDATRQKGLERTVRSLLRKLGVITPHPGPPPQGGREYSEQGGREYPVEVVGHRVVHGCHVNAP